MNRFDYQLALTTCPNQAAAEALARALVTDGLAACVNVLPAMRSIYRWRGNIEAADEYLLLIKGKTTDYPAIERRIRELHNYELPEVIAVPIVAGLPAYLAWLGGSDPM